MIRQSRLITSQAKRSGAIDPFSHLARPLTPEELASVKSVEGYPSGSDVAIQAMSVPPYYTACPNPFLSQIFAHWQGKRTASYPKSGDETGMRAYHREPFAADITEGKQDPIYKVHSYHTKVPPRAIVQYILHYTRPGDILLDAFCGSGMTGVAAQLCGNSDPGFRVKIEAEWKALGHPAPQWGARRVILCDLSPSATAIAANYNLPLDPSSFEKAALEVIEQSRQATRHLYNLATQNSNFNYAIWSQIFSCPECGVPLNFMELAYDLGTRQVSDRFVCPSCGSELNKDRLEKCFVSQYDPIRKALHRQVDYALYRISRGERHHSRHERPTEADLELARQSSELPLPEDVLIFRLPLERMYHGSRLGPKGVEYLHDLYFRRQIVTLANLWRRTRNIPEPRLRSALCFLIDQAILPASKLARYPQLSPLGGVYYLPSMIAENNPIGWLENKFAKVRDYFAVELLSLGQVLISTNSATQIPGLPDNSIDYVFTDPPFGENIFYSDMNLIVEAWYGVFTAVETEAIIDKPKNKDLNDYHTLMYRSFLEYHRVLKPERWITVVFHNSNNAVWNAIQESMLEAGFIVADVRILDKQQRSYRQVTSSAVKQDLVISAYKPVEALERKLKQAAGNPESAWEFVREHLRFLPIFQSHEGVVEIIRERQAYTLYDRMVAAHVQRGLTIPVDYSEFIKGLHARFPERDGMFFLADQVLSYEKGRAKTSKIEQLALFVSDEKSALQWLRRELDSETGNGPQTYSDLQPKFLRELHKVKYEELPELRDLLRDNFLQDEAEHWYIPDPDRQADLEAMRQKSLLREFSEYPKSKGRLRIFRSEAVRAGFSHAWRVNDYATIVKLAERLPEDVLQEDQNLLMYYHNAYLRLASQPRQLPLM